MTVHVVEPGGRGGIHQHAVALAAALAGTGTPVVLHTAPDAETVPCTGAFARRPCLRRFARLRPAPLRRAAVTASWLVLGVLAIVRRAGPGDVVHVQGRFRPELLALLVAGLRLRRCVVAFTPHTTFSRRGSTWDEHVVRWIARAAGVTFVFCDEDGRRMAAWGVRAEPAPLLLLVPDPEPAAVEAWRRRWGAGAGAVVLFAGQLRHDKGLDDIVRAAARWGDGLVLAVVGEDVGALTPARALAGELGVPVLWDEGYLPLPRFVAAVAAADVVVCPYRAASQSAVLAMAATLGRPTVATAVGGLADVATVVVPPGDPDALARGVRHALGAVVDAQFAARADDAVPYLRAYGAARCARER